MKSINKQVKDCITDRGIKLTKVAESTGISYQRLNRILNQNATMSASELITICLFLELDPMSFKVVA